MEHIDNIILDIINRYASVPLTKEDLFSIGQISPVDTLMIFLETEIALGIVIPEMEEYSFIKVKDYITYVTDLLQKININ